MKRALVSVSNKSGLIEFLTPLCKKGLEVISTGGTLKFLLESGLPAKDVSEVTNFPEVLDGRVKTLHPHIHMGLLARKELASHVQQMDQHHVQFFDLVVGNLYPFEQTALNLESTFDELIEKIDIGGPSFLRSAAKNFKNIIVISDPADYSWVLSKYLSDQLTMEDRKKLALKVFSLTSYYDALIMQKLSTDQTIDEKLYLNLPLKKQQTLRYGENSQQSAVWFKNPLIQKNLAHAEIIQGKELSYNNLLDIDAAAGLVAEFIQPACVAVKHNNPCGAAVGEHIYTVTQKAIESDPKSIFGGILAFNHAIDIDVAQLLQTLFLECIIAPGYTQKAIDRLATKKNLRVLRWPEIGHPKNSFQFRSVSGGLLAQSEDSFVDKNWKFVGEAPNEKIRSDLIFAEKVCGYLKSNSIAMVYQGQTVGLGMGQVNRIDSVHLALERLEVFRKNHQINLDEVVVASDAFFPFADSLHVLKAAGLSWIIQPGGSVKDLEVIEFAQKNKMNMVLSGIRHFRH